MGQSAHAGYAMNELQYSRRRSKSSSTTVMPWQGALATLACVTWASPSATLQAAVKLTARQCSATATRSADTFAKMRVPQLQERLVALGLPKSGRKGQLLKRLSGTAHLVRPVGGLLSTQKRDQVRSAMSSGYWNMSLVDWYVRPPRALGSGARNPAYDLGECGDMQCALCRLKEGSESVRSDSIEFCATEIARHYAEAQCSDNGGIIYCSLGCGCLYFDWELLRRITGGENLRVAQVWLLDRMYRPSSNTSAHEERALGAFARWFGDAFQIHAFRNAASLRRHAAAFSCQADIVLQCDSVDTFKILDEDHDFCDAVLRDDALNLQMYSQRLGKRRPGPGRRREPVPVVAVRAARKRRSAERRATGTFEVLKAERWEQGKWIPDWLTSLGFDDDWESGYNSIEEELRRQYR